VIQIDLKDVGNIDAKIEVIRLIRKYGRQRATIIGSEFESDTQQMHDLAQEIPKFVSADVAFRILFAYWTGLLPFMKISHDVFAAPYVTRDYLRMKLRDAREKSPFFYIYIPLVILANWSGDRMVQHLNKRGICTNYWVINDEDEMDKVI
jgi:glycerophosphoryl diester phosphodiesterase